MRDVALVLVVRLTSDTWGVNNNDDDDDADDVVITFEFVIVDVVTRRFVRITFVRCDGVGDAKQAFWLFDWLIVCEWI